MQWFDLSVLSAPHQITFPHIISLLTLGCRQLPPFSDLSLPSARWSPWSSSRHCRPPWRSASSYPVTLTLRKVTACLWHPFGRHHHPRIMLCGLGLDTPAQQNPACCKSRASSFLPLHGLTNDNKPSHTHGSLEQHIIWTTQFTESAFLDLPTDCFSLSKFRDLASPFYTVSSAVRGQILCDWPFTLQLQSLDTFSLHQSPYYPSTCDVWNILLDAFKSNSVKRSCADEAKKSRNLNKNTSEYKQNGWYQQKQG